MGFVGFIWVKYEVVSMNPVSRSIVIFELGMYAPKVAAMLK